MADLAFAFAYYIKDGQLHGILTMHVDNIKHCGTQEFDNDVIKPMFEKFKFRTVQRVSSNFLDGTLSRLLNT